MLDGELRIGDRVEFPWRVGDRVGRKEGVLTAVGKNGVVVRDDAGIQWHARNDVTRVAVDDRPIP